MSQLSITSNGLLAKVKLDGVDISHSLTGVTMRYGTGNPPTAVLDVCVFRDSSLDAVEALAIVPDDTAELLVRLGWTPPKDQPIPADGTGKGEGR